LYLVGESDKSPDFVSQLEQSLEAARADLKQLKVVGIEWTCEIMVYVGVDAVICRFVELPESLMGLVSSLESSITFIVCLCENSSADGKTQ